MRPMSATPRSAPPRPPTLRDVAELAGVSIKTVSNVVNDFPHVRESTRERVQEAVLQLGYRPQAAAQQLRTGASRMVTLALPPLKCTYSADIGRECSDEAQLRDRTVVLRSTSAGRGEARNVRNGFKRIVGDGLIFSPLRREEELVARMERTPQPSVFIGEHLPESR